MKPECIRKRWTLSRIWLDSTEKNIKILGSRAGRKSARCKPIQATESDKKEVSETTYYIH